MSAKAAAENPPPVILIAEDDANDVLLLKRAFAKLDTRASLFFVSNGQSAISYLKGEPPFSSRGAYPYPSLLLLDVNMPGVGGLEVLEWLAANPAMAGPRVVIFSSCVAPEASRRATHLGAHSCITKPLNPGNLLPLMQDLPGFSKSGHAPG
jgi:two-component system response regulator